MVWRGSRQAMLIGLIQDSSAWRGYRRRPLLPILQSVSDSARAERRTWGSGSSSGLSKTGVWFKPQGGDMMSQTMQHDHLPRRPGRPKKANARHNGRERLGAGGMGSARPHPAPARSGCRSHLPGALAMDHPRLGSSGRAPSRPCATAWGTGTPQALFDKADLDRLIEGWKEAA